MAGRLTTLQENVAKLLTAMPELKATGIEIITAKKGSIQTQLATAMAGLNAAIIVYPISGGGTTPNVQGPRLGRVSLTLRVTVWAENFEAGTANDIAELALRLLHQTKVKIAAEAECQMLMNDSGESIIPIDHPSYDISDVLLFTQLGLVPYQVS